MSKQSSVSNASRLDRDGDAPLYFFEVGPRVVVTRLGGSLNKHVDKGLESFGPLEPKNLDDYTRDGIVTLAVPHEVNQLRRGLIEEMGAWLETVAGISSAADEIPEKFVHLAKADRRLLGKLYKVSRRLPAARQLSAHRWFVDVAAQIMKTPLVSCCTFVNVRFDLPQEERYLTPIHQDFPYIQGSLNGVTLWLPLFDTPRELGPPAWIPGSHRWGVLKVKEFALEQAGGSGAKSFELADHAEIDINSKFVSQPVAAGTALLFSTLLVHRSNINRTNRARLNIQLRFDDAFASESIERNYPEGLYLGDNFSSSYPEYIA